jgi:predicted SAM-dependent methyltransferase
MKSKSTFIRAANKLLKPANLHLRATNDYGSLELYPDKSRPKTPKYINIGAGSFFHPYWHNVDTPNDYYRASQKGNLHISYDLTTHAPLPFESNSLEVAYTSHVVEHIGDSDVLFLFKEIYRCLRAGGLFRITCPDIDLEYDAYQRRDRSFWRWKNAYGKFNGSIEQNFLDHFATILTTTHPDKTTHKMSDEEVRDIFTKYKKEDALDYFIEKIPQHERKSYPGDHVNWFNVEKLRNMLVLSGFSEGSVMDSRYGQSVCPLLRNTLIFDNTVPELSLYVECVK